MALEVIVNGRPTGRVGAFIDRDGDLYAKPSELRDLGFAMPPDMEAGAEPIPFSTLPNARGEVNEVKQTLNVVASDAALAPTELSGAAAAGLAPVSPSGYGALLNYDMLGTFTGQQNTGGALLGLRAFSPYGVLESTGLANVMPLVGQQRYERLDTAYTFSDPVRLRQWKAGDVITGALSWSRAVRLGGVQLSSDFDLRPDLITYPLPAISASAAVPSTVDVLVNGIRQFSQTVQPGPFAVQSLPVVTGAGEVAVATQDALGRQTLVTLPFYASKTLLKPGLASYSLDIGSVRQNYGLVTDRYTGWAIDESFRYGLNDWLTLENHGEATEGLVLFGAGGAAQVGTVGIVTAAVSGSSGRGGLSAQSGGGVAGGLASIGFQRVSPKLSFSVNGAVAASGYRDLAAVNESPMPGVAVNASVGYALGDWGNIGAGYVKQISRALPPGSPLDSLRPGSFQTGSLTTGSPPPSQAAYSGVVNPHVNLVTASYSVPVAGIATVYATGFKDLHDGRSYGAGIGISFALDDTTSASVGSSVDSGHVTSSASVAKSAVNVNDYGYRVQDSEGAAAERLAEGEFLSPWGHVSVGVDQSPGQMAGRAGARGAITWLDGHVFASDQINDSFAVVHTGDIADVPVLYENRASGVSDSGGRFLVPSLLSYRNNRLAVDASKLPPDIEVGQTSVVVRPPDRSGVVVEFNTRKVFAALLKLRDSQGRDIPLGSVVKVEGAADQPVGYDGEAYVTGLKPTNRVAVERPDGTVCVVQFAYKPVPGDIPDIGPLRCQ